jgi:hypothetical protein
MQVEQRGQAKEMTINCPICSKVLPDKLGSYKEDKIHEIHSFIDELNADAVALSDPVILARMRARWDKI